MDNTDTLLDVGLSFTCDYEKDIPFIGQEALLELKQQAHERGGLCKRLVSLLVKDPEPLLHHGEIMWRNGRHAADIRSASYGHSLGGAVGLAMIEDENAIIDKSYINNAHWQVQVGNCFYPVELSFRPLYDPQGLRIKS